MSKGIQAYKSSSYAAAVDAFQKAVDLDPDSVDARLYLATAWMSQYIPGAEAPENLETARRAEAGFLEVLKRDPYNKTAAASLASLKYQQAQGTDDRAEKLRKLDAADAWYQKLAEIDPQDKEAYYSLGVIDWVRWYAPWMKARAELGMAPEAPGPIPDNEARLRLKAQYSDVIERGISNFQHALEIDPEYDDAMAYMNLMVRERADLVDSADEYRREIDQADQWVQRALDTKKMKARREEIRASAPKRIRIDGNVQQESLIRRVDPVYPADARIQGTVRFTAIIGADGRVASLQVVSGHPLLVPSALEAVRQWEYKPALLNGEPVEVITTVDVNFVLGLNGR